ncbi:cell division protein FtsK [Enterococcus sp. AZ192]|uniref:cell division protein FtsK n=1 Tax=unclassified Enterococcus TaxID=2608891 RepID=UPI003D2D0A57
MAKYRRIIRNEKSKRQGYQYFSIALVVALLSAGLSGYCYYISIGTKPLAFAVEFFKLATLLSLFCTIIALIGVILLFKKQERVTTFDELHPMSSESHKIANKVAQLFNDKQITDVLKLSNMTRYGEEMPLVYVWISEDYSHGYLAIENIANYERMAKDKYEQRVSGLLSNQYKHYSVVSSKLSKTDSYVIFNFEDTLTSQRFNVTDSKDSLQDFVCKDVHAIQLSKNLIWYSDVNPHLSIIARTRAGKSVLAGRYMARLMQLQGWKVEYNSAKYDRYVKEFNGKSTATEIVERAEYWIEVMKARLQEINDAEKEKYLEMENMDDIAIFFDEIGNLNAALELDKPLKKRWESAINQLTATGASTGIHVIAISQFATKEGFLPSLARTNCSEAVIMLGGAADSADERKYLMAGFADMPKRTYRVGEGIARILSSGEQWETPHFYEAPWFE